jgi:hypothetical protein
MSSRCMVERRLVPCDESGNSPFETGGRSPGDLRGELPGEERRIDVGGTTSPGPDPDKAVLLGVALSRCARSSIDEDRRG